jgi:hypothetical protein
MRILAALVLTLFCTLVLQLPAPAGGEKMAMPTNLGKVNTKADEDDPFLANNQVLLYTSNAGGKYDILVSQRQGGSKTWPAGRPYPGLDRRDCELRSPFVHGGKLYFATNKVPDPKLKDLKNFDIVVKTGERAPLILPGISEKEDELHPWITSAGREFYFSRMTDDGWVLLVARGPNPGPIGDPIKLGFKAGFHHATLSASGLIMFLQGPLPKDRTGLYRSRRAKVGAQWSKPEPLTTLNNPEGPRGDMSPCLSSDGKRLYFASDRPGGMGGLDLWVVETAQLKMK